MSPKSPEDGRPERTGPKRTDSERAGSERSGPGRARSERTGPQRGRPKGSDPHTGARTPAAAKKTTKRAEPRRRPRTWTRWCLRQARRGAVLALVVAIVGRIVLAFALPSLVETALHATGLEGTVRRTQLGLTTGRIEIWDVRLPTIADGSLPPARLETLTLDVSLLALLTGGLHVSRAEVDGLDLYARRDADGSWCGLIDLSGIGGGGDEEPEEDEPPERSGTDRGLADLLRPPLSVDALRVQGVRLHATDLTGEHAKEHLATLDLTISDFGTERPTRLTLTLTAPRVADVVRADLQITPRDGAFDHLTLTLDLDGEGLRPAALIDLLPGLAAAGMRADADNVRLATRIEAVVERAAAPSGDEVGGDGDLVAECTIRELALTADERSTLTLERAECSVERISRHGIAGLQGVLDGLYARAARNADGSIRAAGFTFGGSTGPARAPRDTSTTDTPAADERDGSGFRTHLESISLRGTRLSWSDAAVLPALNETTLQLDDISIEGVRLPATADPMQVRLRGHVQDTLETIAVDATLIRPRARASSTKVAVRLEGFRGEGVRGYLASAGLVPNESAAGNVEIRARVQTERLNNGGTQVSAELTSFVLESGEDRLTVSDCGLEEFVVGGPDGAFVGDLLRVGTIEAAVERLEDGTIRLPLVSIAPRPPSTAEPPTTSTDTARDPGAEQPQPPGDDAAVPPAPTQPSPSGRSTLPRISIGRTTIGPWNLRIEDRISGQTLENTLEGEIEGLHLGGGAKGPGRIEIRATSPGRVEQVVVTGTCSGKETLGIELAVRAEGVSARRLAEVLGATDLEATRTAAPGRFQADLSIAWEPTDGGDSGLEFRLDELELAFADDEPVVAVRSVAAPAVAIGAGGLDLGEVSIDGVRTRLRRTAKGAIKLGPITLAGTPAPIPTPPPADAPAPGTGDDVDEEQDASGSARPDTPTTTPSGPTPSGPTPSGPVSPSPQPATTDNEQAAPAPARGPTLPSGIRFAQVALRDFSFALEDERAATALSTAPAAATPTQASGPAPTAGDPPFHFLALSGDLVLGPYQPGTSTVDELPIELTLRPESIGGVLQLDGSVREDRTTRSLSAEFGIEASGLSPRETILAYAPQSDVLIDDASLRAQLLFEQSPLADEMGGIALRALVSDLALTDRSGGDERVWLAADQLEIDVARLLPDHIEISAVTGSGLRALVERAPSGRWVTATGIAIATSPSAEPPPPNDPAAEARRRLQAFAAGARSEIEDLRVGTFEVELAELTVIDPTAPSGTDGTAAEPIRIRATLRATEELVLLDSEADLPPHLRLHAEGAVLPIVEDLRVDVDLAPLDALPRFEAEIAMTGIHGARLAEFDPRLDQQIDASQLDGGEFKATLRGILEAQRRGPFDFDLRDGFGLEVELSNVELRAEHEGEIIAGVENILFDAARIGPNKRGGTDYDITALDVRTPRLRATRSAEGLRVAGVLLRTQTPAEPSAADTTESKQTEPPAGQTPNGTDAPPTDATPPAAPPKTAPPTNNNLRIEEMSVNGLDVVYRDATREPATLIPLTDLELSVRDLARGPDVAHTEPTTFEVFLHAGEVPLPKHIPESAFLGVGEILTAAVEVVTGRAEAELENRPLFGEISLSGSVTAPPDGVMTGQVRGSVSGLELTGLRGLAAESGIAIGDGLFDLDLTAKLRGAQGVKVGAVGRFARLSVSEPVNGPISRFLRLPAPLDTVLYVLRDNTGEQRIPVDFTVGSKGLSTSALLSTLSSALGSVIRDAITTSPLRVTSPLTDLLRLTGGSPEDLTKYDRALAFPVGATTLDAEAREALRVVARKVANDRNLVLVASHDLSRSDNALVALRANPTEADSRDLVARIRQRNSEIARERERLVVRARSAYAVGDLTAAADATERLRILDRERADNENALDRLLALILPGAERRRDTRTRKAVRDLADARLQQVAEIIREVLPTKAGERAIERLELRRPRSEVREDIALGEGGRIELRIRRRRR